MLTCDRIWYIFTIPLEIYSETIKQSCTHEEVLWLFTSWFARKKSCAPAVGCRSRSRCWSRCAGRWTREAAAALQCDLAGRPSRSLLHISSVAQTACVNTRYVWDLVYCGLVRVGALVWFLFDFELWERYLSLKF